MNRVAVINAVGLAAGLVGGRTPRMAQFAEKAGKAVIRPAFPSVTCTAQASYITGSLPRDHGIVGNGWYNRELAEVHFWKQPEMLVLGRKLWDELKEADRRFTCAKLFWWYNMYSSADYTITPRPIYPADGRKVFDIYSWPYAIRPEIKQDLGEFPFPSFWGPTAGVDSRLGRADAVSRWIARSAQWIEERFSPALSLIYLPHLDYNLQRHGPDDPRIERDLGELDAIVGGLIDFFNARGVRPIILSEYGIVAADQPVHLNRVLRKRGWIVIKEELGRELIDCGASRAFAVADHQIAHIYIREEGLRSQVRRELENTPGVEAVLGPDEKRAAGMDHPRAGDLVAVAARDSWFTYYYWEDDLKAPDFARSVDIHRKPGYDPVELFLDPQTPCIQWKIMRKLIQKKLGFRTLLDVIPLDASLVKGSHGRMPDDEKDFPVCLGGESRGIVESTEVYSILKQAVLC